MYSILRSLIIAPTLLIIISLFSSLSYANSTELAQSADLAFINGKVYSLNWGEPSLEGLPSNDAPFNEGIWQPDATAIAIIENQIAFVGSDNAVKQYIDASTQVIDLKGATESYPA